MYLAQERRQYILRLLEQRGSLRTTTLARELGVTDETVRTDLVEMQRRGLLQRVHGGARYVIPKAPVLSNSPRLDVQLIRLVLRHLQRGMRIYAEPTPIARVLISQMQDIPCTFLTASPMLLAALAPEALPHKVICTGGVLDKSAAMLTHPAPADLMRALKPDIAILTPPALSAAHAAYHHAAHAAWATAATQIAPTTLVVVPSSALTAAAEHTAQLSAYTLITEDNIPRGFESVPSETVPYISEADIADAEI